MVKLPPEHDVKKQTELYAFRLAAATSFLEHLEVYCAIDEIGNKALRLKLEVWRPIYSYFF